MAQKMELPYCRPAISIVWNGLLFVSEISIGLRTHSLCLLVHGLHTLYKAVEEVIIIICAKIPQTGTNKNTFGWARTHVLGVTINSVFLAALCFSTFVSSLKRLVTTEHLHDPVLLVILGSIGAASGCISLAFSHILHFFFPNTKRTRRTKDGATFTECPEREQFMRRKGQLDSHPVIDKRWTLTSVAAALVIIVDGLIHMFEKGKWTNYVDAVSSIVMIVIIIGGTLPKFRSACLVLMQAVPGHMEVQELAEKLKREVPGIESLHEFHLWQLTGRHIVATVHIRLKCLNEFIRVADDVRACLLKEGVHLVTVQPEIEQIVDKSDTMTNASSDRCLLKCGHDCRKKKCCCDDNPDEDRQIKRRSGVESDKDGSP